MTSELVEEIFGELRGLGELRSRRMFGGFGLYADDVFFGLIAHGVLYFKVDEGNLSTYETAGSRPFGPEEMKLEQKSGRKPGSALAYYEVPDSVMARRSELLEWARAALAAAKRRDAGKKRRNPCTPGAAMRGTAKLRSLKNLGPKSVGWLADSGFLTRADLERVGALEAYRTLLEDGVSPNLNLLYALEGALLDLEITRISAAIKTNLRDRLALGSAQRKKG